MIPILRSLRPSVPLKIRLSVPQVSYAIHQPFQWPWFPALAYGFMLIALLILIPVNVALQGYQVVTTNTGNANYTQDLWFHRFMGRPKPGSLCEPHTFQIGDIFTTRNKVFAYSITSMEDLTDGLLGSTAGSHKELSLDSCDVQQVGLELNPVEASVSGNALIVCTRPDFLLTAYTSLAAGQYAANTNGMPMSGSPYFWSKYQYQYMNAASADLYEQLRSLGESAPMTIGATSPMAYYCPTAIATDERSPMMPPPYNVGNNSLPVATCWSLADSMSPPIKMSTIVVNAVPFNTPQNVTQLLQPVVNNFLQVMAALVRFDLGNHLPNSFLNNTLAVLAANNTFLDPFINFTATDQSHSPYKDLQDSRLYQSVQSDLQARKLPVEPDRLFDGSIITPSITTTYECRLTVPKSAGSATISVIVATLSISSTIWTLLIMTASCFAKRNQPKDNHDSEDGVLLPVAQSNDIEKGDTLSAAASSSELGSNAHPESTGEYLELKSFGYSS